MTYMEQLRLANKLMKENGISLYDITIANEVDALIDTRDEGELNAICDVVSDYYLHSDLLDLSNIVSAVRGCLEDDIKLEDIERKDITDRLNF